MTDTTKLADAIARVQQGLDNFTVKEFKAGRMIGGWHVDVVELLAALRAAPAAERMCDRQAGHTGNCSDADGDFLDGAHAGSGAAPIEGLADAIERGAERVAQLVREQTAALSAELARVKGERDADAKDAARYRWLRHHSRGTQHGGKPAQRFQLPHPEPVSNIMKGSVAQHLDAAIDAALTPTAKEQT